MPRLVALAFAFALALPVSAGATLSVLAVEPESHTVGAVVASCVGDQFHLPDVVAIDPAHGGVISQSYFHAAGRDRILELLVAGNAPSDALAAVTTPSFDPEGTDTGVSLRQYAAVDLLGQSESFTGAGAVAYAASRELTSGGITFTVQGNYLTGPGVLDALEAGMTESKASLGHRLLAALRAVAVAQEGDARCAPHVSNAAYFELHDGLGAPLTSYVVTDAASDAALELATEAEAALAAREKSAGETSASNDAHDDTPNDEGSHCAMTPHGSIPSAQVAAWSLACAGWSLARRRRARGVERTRAVS